jgi:hypothetical protein
MKKPSLLETAVISLTLGSVVANPTPDGTITPIDYTSMFFSPHTIMDHTIERTGPTPVDVMAYQNHMPKASEAILNYQQPTIIADKKSVQRSYANPKQGRAKKGFSQPFLQRQFYYPTGK